MGYTHGTPHDAEFKTCTCCGETYPNTIEYFHKNNRTGLNSICKKCHSEKSKDRNEKMKSRFSNNLIEYDGEKICTCCGKSLPNSYKYFPVDKSTISGLRNKCRECDSRYGEFLLGDNYPRRRWTEEEDNLLIKHYKNYTGKELQEKFFQDRTVRSIESRGSNLGLVGKTEETVLRSNNYRSEAVINALTGRTLSEEWKKKISDTKKEYFKTHHGWWLGKHRSDDERKLMSERMKGKWAGDKNPRHIHPLNGEENGRWKGGVNQTYVELRSETKNWQQDSMNFCGYKCVITGGYFNNIHHTFPFRDIVDEAFSNTNIEVRSQVADYSYEEFEILRNEIHMLHDIYGYGACVCKSVHKLFHDEYGYTKFTPYDFLDFVYRIDCGEFDKWFEENNLQVNINYEYINYLEGILQKMKCA